MNLNNTNEMVRYFTLISTNYEKIIYCNNHIITEIVNFLNSVNN